MNISALLEVEKGVTALIGGGGKTTLMYTMVEELRRRGTVLVTTSTHIQRPAIPHVADSGRRCRDRRPGDSRRGMRSRGNGGGQAVRSGTVL